MTPFFAELIGTMILILLGNGVVANVVLKRTKGNGTGWMVITTGWGLAVFAAVVVAAPYSGAHLNPAITLGFAVTGKFAWGQVVPYIVAQLVGAAIGAVLVWLFYYRHYIVSEDAGAKLATFCTAPAIRNNGSNFFSEFVGTFVLMFVVLYITNGELFIEESATTLPIGLGSVGALPVAFVVWVIGLSLGGTTGYAINPARDFAPRLMHALLPVQGKGTSEWSYAWIPVIAPVAGAIFAGVLYLWLL
ncbi:MAG TPA: aquaporin family protein [Candidatus Avirikenella pullistercoris]|nr:aquaporin family protein [Candidatus Avirikenella pullistercoris]